MTERKREKIHILTFHRTIELYLICFLNGNSIERISLEKYLIREKEGKRIAFKDVYLPLIEQLDLPIAEESNENHSRGRYNPIIWTISLENLLNDFISNYFEYLCTTSWSGFPSTAPSTCTINIAATSRAAGPSSGSPGPCDACSATAWSSTP